MSGRSRYVIASDGLPARKSGTWARDKLQAVSDFSTIVNRAMQYKWRDRCFIDLMAGCGLNAIAGSALRQQIEFDGSPLIAKKCTPGFTSMVFVESEPGLQAALTTRLGGDPRATIIAGDCNDTATVTAIRRTVPGTALGIVFVDNLGLDVRYSTLRQLTANRRWDLVVTLQVSAMRRTVHLALTDAAQGVRFDEYFGTSQWRQLVADVEARRVPERNVGRALSQLYLLQLAALGYVHQTELRRPMRNSRNATLYTVQLLSRHPLGAKLFDAVSPRGEKMLFDDL